MPRPELDALRRLSGAAPGAAEPALPLDDRELAWVLEQFETEPPAREQEDEIRFAFEIDPAPQPPAVEVSPVSDELEIDRQVDALFGDLPRSTARPETVSTTHGPLLGFEAEEVVWHEPVPTPAELPAEAREPTLETPAVVVAAAPRRRWGPALVIALSGVALIGGAVYWTVHRMQSRLDALSAPRPAVTSSAPQLPEPAVVEPIEEQVVDPTEVTVEDPLPMATAPASPAAVPEVVAVDSAATPRPVEFKPPVSILRVSPGLPPGTVEQPARVVLRVLVDAQGRAVRVLLETGNPDSPAAEAAIEAVLRSRYRPATEDGAPVGAWTSETFVFEPTSAPAVPNR